MRHATILVAILALVPLASVTAQVRQPPVERGARVRVTVPRPCPDIYMRCSSTWPRQNVGTFLAWKADSLVMESNGDTLTLSLASVTLLELSTPGGSRAGQGALIGLGVAGLGGAVLVGTACAGDQLLEDAAVGCAVVGAALFGAGGALIGALVGASIFADARWEEVPLDRLRVSVGPQGDGRFGFGLSVRF